MKIEVTEIGWGLCKDQKGEMYVGYEDKIQKMDTGEIFEVSKRNENDEVIEIEDEN